LNRCKRGHSTWHKTRFITDRNKIKIKCDYIIGYRLVEGKGSKQSLMCGDLPIGKPLPTGYTAVGEIEV